MHTDQLTNQIVRDALLVKIDALANGQAELQLAIKDGLAALRRDFEKSLNPLSAPLGRLEAGAAPSGTPVSRARGSQTLRALLSPRRRDGRNGK